MLRRVECTLPVTVDWGQILANWVAKLLVTLATMLTVAGSILIYKLNIDVGIWVLDVIGIWHDDIRWLDPFANLCLVWG